MTEVSALIGLLVAALGGAGIGVERQWSGHATGRYARFAGIRTFTLIGTVSGIAGLLARADFPALAAILLAGPAIDDHSADWQHSTALLDAQQQAQADARRDRAAQQLCIKLHGPGTAYRWTDAGDLVCTDHRTGRAAVVVASKGGAL